MPENISKSLPKPEWYELLWIYYIYNLDDAYL
jgi:hypothetical protein